MSSVGAGAAIAASLSAAIAAAAVLTGCAAGTSAPNQAPPRTYTREILPNPNPAVDVAGGEPQQFRSGHDLPGQWWELFGSRQLDSLIQQAMTAYPDVQAQQAALREAQEEVRAQLGVFFPQFQGVLAGNRSSVSGASIFPGFPNFITNVFQANVGVSYTLDIFGAERHTLDELKAQAEAQNFQLEASYLAIAANVATSAIQLASIRAQIEATQQILDIEGRQLALIRQQFELGSQTRANVLQQQSNVAAVRATLPPLQQQAATTEHALAVLTGRFPADVDTIPLQLSDLRLPQQLPVSLPSALIVQRPDVRMQQALVHKAAAAVGVATANLLPQLTLSASLGDESSRIQQLIRPESGVWSLTGQLTQPLFEGGTLRARRRGSIDTYQQVAADYRLTVLQAFQNVADTLTALVNDAQALQADEASLQAATESLDLIRRQYADGAVDYVALLTSQQAYQQARIAEVRAVAARYTDTVSLFQALGGGWWNRRDPGSWPNAGAPTPADASRESAHGS